MNKRKWHSLWMLGFLIRRVPLYLIGTLAQYVIMYATSYIANIYFLELILEKLAARQPIRELIVCLAAFAFFCILSSLYDAIYNESWNPQLDLKVEKALLAELFEKTKQADFVQFETPEFYNEFAIAANDIVENAKKTVNVWAQFVAASASIAAVWATYRTLSIGAVLIASLAILLSSLVNSRMVKLNFQRDKDLRAANRRTNYFYGMFFSREAAKERKMTNADVYLMRAYASAIQKERDIQKTAGRKLLPFTLTKEYFCQFLLMEAGIIAYLLYHLYITKDIRVYEFVPIYNGIHMVISSLGDIFSRCIPALLDNNMRIGKYRMFICSIGEATNTGDYIPATEPETICLENISFAYPGCDQLVLQNISLQLEPGQTIALVGKNGAGKSTLCSLLSGLYQPTSGVIRINQTKLEEFDLKAYCARFNAIYQNDQLFDITIGENVALDTIYDAERVTTVLKTCGIDLAAMGLDCAAPIGKLLYDNGVILSGGEVQKMLIARSLYRNQPYIILDEPSAALDARAEYAFNQFMAELAKEHRKTIVIVTHRLTTVPMADMIHVLDEGKIVESGSFLELKSAGGLFQTMWELQSKKYSIEI